MAQTNYKSKILFIFFALTPVLTATYSYRNYQIAMQIYQSNVTQQENLTLAQLKISNQMASYQQAIAGDLWGALGNYGDQQQRSFYLNNADSHLSKIKDHLRDLTATTTTDFKLMQQQVAEYTDATEKLLHQLKEKTPKGDGAVETAIKNEWINTHTNTVKAIEQFIKDTEVNATKKQKQNLEALNSESDLSFNLVLLSGGLFLLFVLLYVFELLSLSPLTKKTQENKSSEPVSASKKHTFNHPLKKPMTGPNLIKTQIKSPTTEKTPLKTNITKVANKNESPTQNKVTSVTAVKRSKAAELIPFDEDEQRTNLGNAEDF